MSTSTKLTTIVLRRTNFGEADRIVTLLSKEQGKLTALVKGCRKPLSKLVLGAELLVVSETMIISGKNDLVIMSGARAQEFFSNIANDLDSLELVYLLLKLSEKHLDQTQGGLLFEPLLSSIRQIDAGREPSTASLWYLVQLIGFLGLEPNLETDRQGDKLEVADSYSYDYENNCFFGASSGKYQVEDIKLLRLCASNSLDKLKNVVNTEQISLKNISLITDLLSTNQI
jgi:DNA repair protein RecO (recombination protein O)